MSYKINKTDGSLLTEVVDSIIDQTACDLTLIGKNVTGYGEFINENFIKLLENFASTSEPNNPIPGQIWWDTSENRLKVYDGKGFKVGSGPVVQGTQPLNLSQGDFWIDNQERQLYFYDGVNLILAGPLYKYSQGRSGFVVSTISDNNGNSKIIVELRCGETLLGIFSKSAEFLPAGQITGYPLNTTIKPGFNVGTVDGFKFNARATSADSLVDGLGNLRPADSFLSAEEDNFANGTLTITDETPLVLGEAQQTTVNVTNSQIQFLSTQTGQDFKITTQQSSTNQFDAVTIKALTNRVGIFNNDPQATLHVGGAVIIDGDLTVSGDTTTINTQNLAVEDKLVELAKTASPSDIIADGGGLVLKGTTDHSLTWSNAEAAWNSTEHFDLGFNKEYRINGSKVLDETSLGSSVVTSNLTSLGTLVDLYVSGLNSGVSISDNVISATSPTFASVDLVLEPKGFGNVSVSDRLITNAQTPLPSDPEHYVATKGYIDNLLLLPWDDVSVQKYEASSGERLFVNTFSTPVTVVLPHEPLPGSTVRFLDSVGSFNSNSLTVARKRVIDFATISGTASGSATGPTRTNVATTSETGAGTGLTVDIAFSDNNVSYNGITTMTINNIGQNYVTGEVLRILGTALGGTSPANDLQFMLKLDRLIEVQEDLVVSTKDAGFGLIYVSPTYGWKYVEVAV